MKSKSLGDKLKIKREKLKYYGDRLQDGFIYAICYGVPGGAGWGVGSKGK